MDFPYPFESARGLEPDALGRIALVDADGKVLAHLPLASAHEFAPKGLGSGDGYGYGFGDGYGYGEGYGFGHGSGDGYGDLFEYAHDVKPDLIGRIALVDADGRVLAHLPLSTAHKFAPKCDGSGDGYGDGWDSGRDSCDGSGFGDGFGGGYGDGNFDGAGSGTESP